MSSVSSRRRLISGCSMPTVPLRYSKLQRFILTKTRTEAQPAIRLRMDDKIEKAAGCKVQPHERLSLLLVSSLALIGAVASTYVFAPFVTVDRLNAELHQSLAASRFQRVYLHLPLSGNAVWEWTRKTGWTVLCAPADIANDARKMLEAVKPLGSGIVPPGTKIIGWPR